MNEKTKYLGILILAVIASVSISYLSILSLPTPIVRAAEVEALVERQVAEELSLGKVAIPHEVSYFAAGNSVVKAYSKTTLENLTIVYRYTCLGNGTVITRSIEYGTFIPAWGAGAIIEEGAVPEALYKIPNYILQASSTTKLNEFACIVFDTWPQIEVLEVYGYT